ncbi:MAG: thiamine phosphate synthase [Pyrinomonadaceae bacterium]|nr:thiamine phosphate synthase [Pyrinomonadaceae bacterium]MCX7638990.1 thiamine phosphate synthase [Pyrinomonadaceae bacterium]MDW8303790.1 thiamine phosphate synthase [Acidobacteriota bacterium]
MLDKTKPLIYLITEGKLTDANFVDESERLLNVIRVAVSVGIPLIQIREKCLSARLIFRLVNKAVALKTKQTKILVNERTDIAFIAGADGVHLPSESIPVEDIRRKFPRDFLIGVSCHNKDECIKAMISGADFVTVSPIFEVPGKGKPKGIEFLKQIAEEMAPFPVIGLGGVNQENYKQVLQVASGFAAIRFLNDETNLRSFEKLYAERLFDDSRS